MFPTVGLWSDVLGGVHLWECSLPWNQCTWSTGSTEEWREAGETKQHHLLRWNVIRMIIYTIQTFESVSIFYSCAVITDCLYTDQHKHPKFFDLVEQLSNILEQEAGYLDLGRSLSWRKPEIPQGVAFRATVPSLQNSEEEKVKVEGQELGWRRK